MSFLSYYKLLFLLYNKVYQITLLKKNKQRIFKNLKNLEILKDFLAILGFFEDFNAKKNYC